MDLSKARKKEPFQLGAAPATKPRRKQFRWKDEPKAKGPGGWKAVFTCTMCSLSPAGLMGRIRGVEYMCGPECLRRMALAAPVGQHADFAFKPKGAAVPEWETYGRHSKAGMRRDLGHYVRSSWEANVGRWLIWQGADYRYEVDVFDVGKGGYCPDFWLTDWKLWLEVKGLWSGKARKKVRAFVEQRPGDRLIVVDKDLYLALRREYVAAYKVGKVKNLEAWED